MNIFAFLAAERGYNSGRRFAISESGGSIFAACKGQRTCKRVKNTFSREDFGTIKSYTKERTFAASQTFKEKRGRSVREYTLTSYTKVVCKSRDIYV